MSLQLFVLSIVSAFYQVDVTNASTTNVAVIGPVIVPVLSTLNVSVLPTVTLRVVMATIVEQPPVAPARYQVVEVVIGRLYG